MTTAIAPAPTTPARPPRPRRSTGAAVPDPACAAAVNLARQAAVEEGGAAVGEHVGVVAEGDRLVAHLFDCLAPWYRGWRWAVTVVRAARAKNVTVDEVVLLPGPEAILAPPWVPWSERLRPGDLGVGDLLPTAEDDDRLVPSYAAGDDPAEDEVAWELGLGRVRVLSSIGRLEAAERWYNGAGGPAAAIAQAAPAKCDSCGFLIPLAGALRQLFGACANEFAPDDGRVVSLDHGCGAHSEAAVTPAAPEPAPTLLDDYDVEIVPFAHAPGSVDDTEPSEPLGHS